MMQCYHLVVRYAPRGLDTSLYERVVEVEHPTDGRAASDDELRRLAVSAVESEECFPFSSFADHFVLLAVLVQRTTTQTVRAVAEEVTVAS